MVWKSRKIFELVWAELDGYNWDKSIRGNLVVITRNNFKGIFVLEIFKILYMGNIKIILLG